MRVFVCEFVTGGGLQGEPVPPGLRHEGDLMLAALVKDLAALSDVEVTVARDGRLSEPALPAEIAWLGGDGDPWSTWERLVDAADAVWPIAPETGGALERLSRLVLGRGRILLGSRPEAVRLAASKLATSRLLGECGVPVVPAWPAARPPPQPIVGAWVLKPDDGAGCEDTFFLERLDGARDYVSSAELHRFVLQPFVEGAPASLSMLCRDGKAVLLSCNRQIVSCRGGVFTYGGGIAGGMEARRAAFEPVAADVARAVPGLWGYVGVDLVDGAEGPIIVEINPRLTTSYVGLREALGENPAALVMRLSSEESLPLCPGTVRPVTVEVTGHHG